MRCKGIQYLIALLALIVPAAPCATTFGSVVAIGGHASDVALDEARGVLYIANFTANRIDILKVGESSIQSSINVSPQPGSIAISPDGQYLLVTHGPEGNLFPRDANRLTLIHLPDMAQQRFSTGVDTPLAATFYSTIPNTGPSNLTGPGLALIVTTAGIYSMDPRNGVLSVVSTFANLVKSLPLDINTYPSEVIQTALSTSADGLTVWGVADSGSQPELVYVFNGRTNAINVTSITAAPPILPRVSVAADGSYAMVGYALFSAPAPIGPNPGLVLMGRFPGRILSTNVTGHAIDSKKGLIYAQIPDNTQPQGPPYTSFGSVGTGSTVPAMLVMEADNLSLRDRILIPENMVGRAVLDSTGSTMYAISDSGVMILPVGSLSQTHRLAVSSEDMLVQTTFCDRTQAGQSLTITDPGGGHTDFAISSNTPGVTVVPAFGTTPATVQVMVDTSKFLASGTTAVTLTVTSGMAINGPKLVRVLVNNSDVNLRGTIVNIPGTLTDILPDPARSRYYVLRQDVNQLLVYDARNNQRIAALRTATTPTKMTFTMDRKYLLVGHENSQILTVFDLEQLQPVRPVLMPGGHFGLSIAESNNMLAVLARDEASGNGVIESIDMITRLATPLGSLGIWKNDDPTYLPGMLVPTSNGRSILFATASGKVALYSAEANTFTVGRKDFTSLAGAVAASSVDSFVIGNYVFNASLVPQGSLDASYGTTTGFSFLDGKSAGYRSTASSSSGIGVIQNLPALNATAVLPISMSEAPLLPTATNPFTRTLAPMLGNGTVVVMTTSGLTVLSSNYSAAVTSPVISSVQNAANGATGVASGGLISVYGSQMSATSVATSQIPLPTALAQSCLSVNGAPIPLLFVSAGQVNAQLPFNVSGNVTMSIHTPAGISNSFNFTVQNAAPAVFMSGTAGPETGLATLFRLENGQLVTPTNPVHGNDTLIIYLTGMGTTSPSVDAGQATPSTLLSYVNQQPVITLGGTQLNVLYAGLVPSYVSGLYQINATVPSVVNLGLEIPLVISQGGSSTTLKVRVVK